MARRIIHSQPFRNFPNRLRINIKTRVWCLISESKQARVPIFSKRKFTTFHTHTYMHIWRQRVHTPPKSYPVVEVSCCALSTLLPRFISPRDCDLRPRTPLPSRFSLPLNPEPTIFIAFHRSFSNLSILSIVQSILTTFVYLYKCYAEYLRDVNQIPFVELFCFLFFFCFFCLLPDCC